ncbi:MAG: NAD(P)H-hydrate dehydratase [Candidatus Anammoxibacter sp.]
MRETTKLPRITSRNPDSHKGDYGRVFVIAGSTGFTGAAYLCSKAALRAGAGLVTLGIPESLNAIMETKLTCVMTLPLAQTGAGTLAKAAKAKILDFSKNYDVIVIGPGLSQHPETKELVISLLQEVNLPIVLDADGLNAIAGKLHLLNSAQNSLVLTPHPGELARLMGLGSTADVQNDRISIAKEFINIACQNKKNEIVLALKGTGTIVINDDNMYTNTTGNPGMASGGTGDVLSGIIAALIGQRFTAFEAARLGVYIHGLAGDIATKEKGEISMIATDIIDCLPNAFAEFSNR